ncbi:hypothetical protein DFH28DRAFT_882776, partial [Melampsora americana]
QSFYDFMSNHVIGGVVSLLNSLNNTPHPYAKIADHLASIVTPPERPTWAKVITVANIVANLCMLSAAVATCVMRKRIGTFSLGNITNELIDHHMHLVDNLVRPNACVCFALGVIGFSALSIIQFTLALVSESMHTVLPGRAALPGIKFLFKWAGSCCFSWSTAAHHICSKWDPSWRQSMMPQGGRSQVPRLVVWSINVTFTLLILVVFTSVIAIFSSGEIYIQQAASSTVHVVKRFRALDARDHHYSLKDALKVLKPLLGLATVLEQISSHVKVGAILWFFWDCLDVVLQFVNVYLAIRQKRDLGPKIGVQDTLRQIMTNQSKISSRTINYLHEQNIMIIISGIIFIACLVLAPILIWTYLNSSIDMVLKVDFVLKSDLVRKVTSNLTCLSY